jgi:RNA 3'-terminal phosphate cyclase (ATP)
MIQIDGSMGEGGGQVLRTALTLAALTGQAMRINHIRAGRSKPGLRAQHLTAVEAIAQVVGAETQGARLGSTALTFIPGPITPGSYRFDIGTAGSTSLVFQTVFLPLSQGNETSTVAITGGTHVPWSPCTHYLEWSWLPILRELGYDARLTLKRAGFYPPGGGRIQAVIRPSGSLAPATLTERGALKEIRGLSASANLPGHIVDRQRRQALRRLKSQAITKIETASLEAPSPGTFLILAAEFAHTRFCTFALGKKGKPAEKVADEAVDALEAFLASGAVVDRYLADQLLLPLATAAGPSALRTEAVTQHLLTNAAVIQAFLPIAIDIEGEQGAPGFVRIHPQGEAIERSQDE